MNNIKRIKFDNNDVAMTPYYKQNGSFGSLNDDNKNSVNDLLANQIVHCLPVKSIGRLKSICKAWNDKLSKREIEKYQPLLTPLFKRFVLWTSIIDTTQAPKSVISVSGLKRVREKSTTITQIEYETKMLSLAITKALEGYSKYGKLNSIETLSDTDRQELLNAVFAILPCYMNPQNVNKALTINYMLSSDFNPIQIHDDLLFSSKSITDIIGEDLTKYTRHHNEFEKLKSLIIKHNILPISQDGKIHGTAASWSINWHNTLTITMPFMPVLLFFVSDIIEVPFMTLMQVFILSFIALFYLFN